MDNKERREEIRSWFKEYKRGLSCEICGENDPRALEFHHVEPLRDAEANRVCDYVCQGYSKKRILEEIDKCLVLCANCHRIYFSD